jgi:hypothetical protein
MTPPAESVHETKLAALVQPAPAPAPQAAAPAAPQPPSQAELDKADEKLSALLNKPK